MVIYLNDVRDMGYCLKGVRLFCQKYNLDYDDLRKNGLDSDLLLKTNDSMAIAIVENKNGR